MADKKLWT